MKFGYSLIVLSFLHCVCFSQPDSENYVFAKANYNQQHYDQAINFLKIDIENGNDRPESQFLLGECYFQKADYEHAIQYYIKSFKYKNDFATYRIAECYAIQNQDYKAVEYLKLYLKTKDKYLKSEIKSNSNFKGIEHSKSWNELWKSEHYTSYENQLDEAKYNITLKKYAEAFYILDRLIIKDENRHRALALRAELYLLTNNEKLAAKDFQKAWLLNKRSIVYKIKAAESLMKTGNFKKAKQLYSEILKDHPEEIEILLHKAQCEMELKKYDQAKFDISEFLRFYPENPMAINIMGNLCTLTGDYLTALENYTLCITTDPKSYIYFTNRADTYFKTGMYENAVHDYSMALDLNPNVAEVYYKKGIANLKINVNDACNDLKQARSMNYHKADDYIVRYCE